jgi:hypothetical protein
MAGRLTPKPFRSSATHGGGGWPNRLRPGEAKERKDHMSIITGYVVLGYVAIWESIAVAVGFRRKGKR